MTGPARRPRRHRGEEGETLIEVLVAVVLMGVAFVAVLGGIGTAIISSLTQAKVTGADSVVRSAAEKVVSDPYASCARGYETPTPPAGYTVTVTVEYWDGVGTFAPSCPTADTGVQKVTLTVHTTGPRPVKDTTLDVVKRESMLS
ncbi:type II secretion system protein [Streptomyces sp. NBC_00083]|uniref:type IV pilus modification PilV family protein n=1 Tax=Streptomyces sp. NBC_00083 TaxID=2975647 RepID=UPI00224F3A2F|nr:type II secretion system protein [Streptomyces sp. NBC_00083]MCX5384165.1 type II secretion system GspH family protein [Streptomyces sp. NBC_00083]